MGERRTWYIEARIGSKNYRGDDFVRFIDDVRGLSSPGPVYVNIGAEEAFKAERARAERAEQERDQAIADGLTRKACTENATRGLLRSEQERDEWHALYAAEQDKRETAEQERDAALAVRDRAVQEATDLDGALGQRDGESLLDAARRVTARVRELEAAIRAYVTAGSKDEEAAYRALYAITEEVKAARRAALASLPGSRGEK